ncbi:hypothetical protein ABPG75_008301 [Micractinium tetrahymenae]
MSVALLLQLAADFEAQGAYAQAVQCLTPVCNASGELPAVVGQARLRCASLLLAHFDNVQEAKSILLTAENQLRQTQGHHLLKCEVWDALARCHQRLGAVPAERSALEAGLKTCRQGATSKDKEALARWRAFFYFRLAEHSLTHVGPEGAGEGLDKLEADGALRLSPVERTLCLLCRATLALTAGDAAAAAPLLTDANTAIEEAGVGDPLLHRHLSCHYAVLFVSMAVVAGRISDLESDGDGSIALLAQLQQQLAEAGGAAWSYPWLPTPAVGAVGNLLHASLLRTLGKTAPAAACLAAAAEVVDQELSALGIDMQGDETQLGVSAIWEGRIYCHLHVLLAEQQVVAALLATRFIVAAELLVALLALLGRFPSLLRDFVPSAHMLLGHYAHGVREHASAAAHFRAVLQSGAAQLQDGAAVAAALVELEGDPAGPAGVRAAVDLLQGRGLRELPHVLALPVQDRTTSLVVNALVAQRTSDVANASVLLTKALKTAHAHLGNTQMVTQVLNVLAPVQASKGDRSGAEQMLSSALTLSKSVGDLSSLVAASRGLQRLFAGTPGGEERAASQRAYMERKQGELAAAVAAAAAGPHHTALLAWGTAPGGAPGGAAGPSTA